MNMPRKKSKKIYCGTITSQQIFDASKPLYETASRCGVHGDTKYNRRKEKRNFLKSLKEENL